MPKRSNRFQRLVVLLNTCLAADTKVIESALVLDKVTGEEREVDIWISPSAAGHTVNIAIEVIGRSRKASVGWVEEMHSKHATLPTDKLILVSERGFTKQALVKAAFHCI